MKGDTMSKQRTDNDSDNEFDRVIGEIDRLEVEPDRHLSMQLDKEVRAITRAAKAAGKPAMLKLTIKATPGPDRRVVFSASFASTLPKPSANAVTLYADEDGAIHQSDPLQIRLPLGAGAKKPETV